MPQFVLECTEHTQEECDAMSREIEEVGVADVMKGREFFCTCPHGHHAGFTVVEGESAEAIQASLPPIFGAHAKVYQTESIRF